MQNYMELKMKKKKKKKKKFNPKTVTFAVWSLETVSSDRKSTNLALTFTKKTSFYPES